MPATSMVEFDTLRDDEVFQHLLAMVTNFYPLVSLTQFVYGLPWQLGLHTQTPFLQYALTPQRPPQGRE